ncbi:Unknown protein [Striga hermonthica]|uniref:Retrotransposon gag domain-containing protein n=1 Tax=Striga hermonthica TaxID=68872 RepID=A0A9N7NF15_STRHE|nr:Unknown protein [Striga hermonthica]
MTEWYQSPDCRSCRLFMYTTQSAWSITVPKNANGFPRGAENQGPYQARPVEIVGERFLKLNPLVFEDAADPVEAEDWLRTVDNMFQYSRVSEEEKVMCASFILHGSAGHWWDTIKCIEDVTTMTSDRFKELFRSKYFTAPIRAMKMNEFIQLRQGGMTVADYIRKFERLSRFAEHMASTDALKTERFLKGNHNFIETFAWLGYIDLLTHK